MTNTARLVISEQIYYQEGTSQPVSTGKPFSISLMSDEQPFGPRKLSIREQWQDVDTGWIKDRASLIHITLLQEARLTIPTREEQRNEEKRVIQLGIWVPPPPNLMDLWDGIVIPIEECRPGSSIRYMPVSGMKLGILRIRCLQAKTAQIMITVFPV